ncbi:hypothetical protein BYT27DRAFT_7217564 [Phlegmacium glaucopus]|nr:hypothetical protein BYT27DRAFT_7217564 [Phlegmacium glaucopus]
MGIQGHYEELCEDSDGLFWTSIFGSKTQFDFGLSSFEIKIQARGFSPDQLLAKRSKAVRLASNNENVAMDYIEYEDGTIVMGDTAKSVCSHACAVPIEMDNHGTMQLPSSWSLAGVTEFPPSKPQCQEKGTIINPNNSETKQATSELNTHYEEITKASSFSYHGYHAEGESWLQSLPTTTISPTSSLSSSSLALSEPPTSSTPKNLTTLPSPKSATPSVAPRPKPQAKSSHQQVTTTTITKTHAQDHPHTGPAETVVTMASNDLQMANAASERSIIHQYWQEQWRLQPQSLQSQLKTHCPSGQLESLGETLKGIVKEARVSTAKEASNTTKKVYTKSESITHAKTFGPGTKRVTTSSSAKNLYHIEYLQLNEPITPATFEAC